MIPPDPSLPDELPEDEEDVDGLYEFFVKLQPRIPKEHLRHGYSRPSLAQLSTALARGVSVYNRAEMTPEVRLTIVALMNCCRRMFLYRYERENRGGKGLTSGWS
jgi:hypothetical protein